MPRLNECDKCGHYSWVHLKGICSLPGCNCGKEPKQPRPESGEVAEPEGEAPTDKMIDKDY